MASSKEYNIGILGVKKPLDCSCQDLLSTSDIVMNGWLRKRALRNKIITMNWPQMYVIVTNQCLYYFNNETSKKAAGSVSFYGFNRICRAPTVKVGDVVWAFKLEHIQPNFRSLYFSAPSESEMIKWMRVMKQAMMTANGKNVSVSGDSQYGESIASEDSWGSSDYNFLETSIYEEPIFRPDNTRDDSDFEDDEVNSRVQFEPSTVPFKPRRLPSAPEIPEYESGYSMQQPASPTASGRGQEYWSAVKYDGPKLLASEIIGNIGEDGVYLVRKSEDNSNVLVVYSGQVKKYRVANLGNGRVTLSTKTEPQFDNMEDMLYHYYSNNLPHSNQKLVLPFKMHDDYTDYEDYKGK